MEKKESELVLLSNSNYYCFAQIKMKKFLLAILLFVGTLSLSSQVYYYETFDFVEGIIGEEFYDWKLVNASSPLGTASAESWYQADMTMGINAYAGLEPNCYVQADKFSTSATTGGTISNWIISPMVTLSDGDSVRFYAISYDNLHRPDRIEVRVSTLGMNSIYPTSANDVGSFTTLIGVINPDQTTDGFPSVQNGQTWEWYHFVVSGIDFGNDARVALRYYVEEAGSQGPNGSAIGIDDFFILGPEGWTTVDESNHNNQIKVYPNPANDFIRIATENNSPPDKVEILDMNGRTINEVSSILNRQTIDVSNLSQGIYALRITTTDKKVTTSRFVKN